MSDCIAVLPARGGSRRIPHKNIKPFCGRPVLEYSIQAAQESGCFRHIVVSTNDDDIAAVAYRMGADVFWRSPEHATDAAIMAEAVVEVLRAYSKKGRVFDYGCVVYPAAPFITAGMVRAGLEALKTGYDVVCPVYKGPDLERAMRITDGKLAPCFPDRKDINNMGWPATYYPAGTFFWFDVAKLILSGTLMPDNMGAIVIGPHEAVDIDTLEDWRFAERLYASRQTAKDVRERASDWALRQAGSSEVT